jgi:PEP-CTERM motif
MNSWIGSLSLSFGLFLMGCSQVRANTVGFQNSGGKVTSNGSSLTVSGSAITNWMGSSGSAIRGLGTLSLKTGSLMSGSLGTGGVFASGGSFSIMGSRNAGLPKATLFKGTFTSPVSWLASLHPTAGPNRQGAWYYTLNGKISGRMSNGQRLSGSLVLSTFDVPKGAQFSVAANLDGGLANLAVPEPGSLGLLASGLVGLAIVLRKRLL